MSYTTKLELTTNNTIKLGGPGNPTSIEGYFIGTKTTPDTGFGPGKLHLFSTETGTVGVWGKTHMNMLLTENHRGQKCLLSFEGMRAPAKKGRRPSYQYKLQYDAEDTIDVSSLVIAAETDNTESFDSQEDDVTSEETAVDEVAPAPTSRPTVVASSPNAAALAKAKQLIGRKAS